MFKQLTFSLCCTLALIHAAAPFAQEREDRTLSHDQMRAIVNEASSESAMHLPRRKRRCRRSIR